MFRWPLVLRFIKGAIHLEVIAPVLLHSIFTAVIVYLDTYVFDTVGIPNTIVSPKQDPPSKGFPTHNLQDTISLNSRGSNPRLPQPNILQPLLGWPQRHDTDFMGPCAEKALKKEPKIRIRWTKDLQLKRSELRRNRKLNKVLPHLRSDCFGRHATNEMIDPQ